MAATGTDQPELVKTKFLRRGNRVIEHTHAGARLHTHTPARCTKLFHSHDTLALEFGDLVLVFVQEVLHFLLVHLNLDRVSLFHLFNLTVFVAQLCARLIKLPLADLPKSVGTYKCMGRGA